jgi:hypothetical protein
MSDDHSKASIPSTRSRHFSRRDADQLRDQRGKRQHEFFLHGNPGDPRIARAYRLSVDCYKQCAGLHDPRIEPVEIPFENTTLPGYFHHALARIFDWLDETLA